MQRMHTISHEQGAKHAGQLPPRSVRLRPIRAYPAAAAALVTMACVVALLPSIALAETIWVPPAAHAREALPAELDTYQSSVISWVRERRAGARFVSSALPACDEANARICVVKALRAAGADVEVETWFVEATGPRSVAAHVSIITRDDFIYRREARAPTYEEALQLGLAAAWQDFERGPGPWLNIYGPEPGKEVRLGGKALCELPCIARVQPGEHVVTLHDRAGVQIAQVNARATTWGSPHDVLIGSEATLRRWNQRKPPLLVSAALGADDVPQVTVPKEPSYTLEALPASTPLPRADYPLAWLEPDEPRPVPVALAVAPGLQRPTLPQVPAERRGGAWQIGPALVTAAGAFGVTAGLRTFFMGARCTLHAPAEAGGDCVEYTAPRHGVGAAWLTAGSIAMVGGVTWWVVGSRPRTNMAVAVGARSASFISAF
jgi:hypothetical protein